MRGSGMEDGMEGVAMGSVQRRESLTYGVIDTAVGKE